MTKSRTVTSQEKELMNELYCKIKTYAGVAREVGRAASTVKRYIDPTYIPKANRPILQISDEEWKDLVEYIPNQETFLADGASVQTKEERMEMEEVWHLLNI